MNKARTLPPLSSVAVWVMRGVFSAPVAAHEPSTAAAGDAVATAPAAAPETRRVTRGRVERRACGGVGALVKFPQG